MYSAYNVERSDTIQRTVEKDLFSQRRLVGGGRIGRKAATPALERVWNDVGVDVPPRQSDPVSRLDVDRYLTRQLLEGDVDTRRRVVRVLRRNHLGRYHRRPLVLLHRLLAGSRLAALVHDKREIRPL